METCKISLLVCLILPVLTVSMFPDLFCSVLFIRKVNKRGASVIPFGGFFSPVDVGQSLIKGEFFFFCMIEFMRIVLALLVFS